MTDLAVVDASVVVTLLIDPGVRGAEAAAVLADTRWHAPDLLPYEVTDVLRRRRATGLLTRAEADDAHAAAARLPVELWPHELLAERIWSLGGAISAYDAAYVALAERLDAVLVTADARLSSAPGTRCRFHLLGA